MRRYFYTDGQIAQRKMAQRLHDEQQRDLVAMQRRLAAGDYSFRDGFPWGRP
jgi:hypothetical protein